MQFVLDKKQKNEKGLLEKVVQSLVKRMKIAFFNYFSLCQFTRKKWLFSVEIGLCKNGLFEEGFMFFVVNGLYVST